MGGDMRGVAGLGVMGGGGAGAGCSDGIGVTSPIVGVRAPVALGEGDGEDLADVGVGGVDRGGVGGAVAEVLGGCAAGGRWVWWGPSCVNAIAAAVVAAVRLPAASSTLG